jgi:outer membrane biogenesis lipoprotein LolB
LPKITVVLLTLIFLLSGCAVTRKGKVNELQASRTSFKEVLKSTDAKNLTHAGFFIQKGRIITLSENSRISLYFTMRYNSEGKYLISLRSRTGIEAFRVFLSYDTILINDRINRQLLYGKPSDFEKISGLPAELLKVSVGDLFSNKPVDKGNGNCVDGQLEIYDYFLGFILNSVIDCKRDKLKSVKIDTGAPGNYITINYLKFREDNYSVPRRIEINDSGRKIKIVLLIDKYLAPWVGDFDFVPGSGYPQKPLI